MLRIIKTPLFGSVGGTGERLETIYAYKYYDPYFVLIANIAWGIHKSMLWIPSNRANLIDSLLLSYHYFIFSLARYLLLFLYPL